MNKKNSVRMKLLGVLAAMLIAALPVFVLSIPVHAENAEKTEAAEAVLDQEEKGNSIGEKAMAAGAVVAIAASAGAISMGIAISKSSDSISRQPEASKEIRTTLMLGLVFVETAIIYALIVAILIIFVL